MQPRRDEVIVSIQAEAANPAEERDSRVLVEALRAHRDAVGGVAAVPANDQRLSEAVMAEARTRSAQLRGAAAQFSNRVGSQPARSVPAWLWLAWLAVIIAAIGVWLYLSRG
jgi:hypothetical protein